MRKKVSFAVAAIGVILGLTIWVSYSVTGIRPDTARTKAGAPSTVRMGSFPPFITVDPSW
jgi:hypothetical protein